MACECIKFRTVAYDSTPYDSDARPKVDALSAYFLHVDDAIECIALDLARSLIADLKRFGNR